jgi:hypothetical protein
MGLDPRECFPGGEIRGNYADCNTPYERLPAVPEVRGLSYGSSEAVCALVPFKP